jgi:enoyl-CoA hydratase
MPLGRSCTVRFLQDAVEARQIGRVNRVFVDYPTVLAGVMDIAWTIAAKSFIAVRGNKEWSAVRDHPVSDGLAWNAAMLQSPDLLMAMGAHICGEQGPEFPD